MTEKIKQQTHRDRPKGPIAVLLSVHFERGAALKILKLEKRELNAATTLKKQLLEIPVLMIIRIYVNRQNRSTYGAKVYTGRNLYWK